MNELFLVLKATLMLTLALVAVRAARRAPAALRALILACAVGVIVALPFAGLVLPSRTLAVPLPGTEPQVVQFGRSGLTPEVIQRDLLADGSAPAPVSTPELPSAMNVLRALWILGALIVAVRIALALIRVSRIRRGGTPWPEGVTDLPRLLRDASSSRRARVFLHPDLGAPMTCGVFRPVIGLPADAPTWPELDLRRALIHEMEHVRRADWLIQLLAEVSCAIYWFHPLVWIASRRLRLESEHACDDAVVRRTGGPEYAQQLVGLAKRLSARRSPVPLLSMADGSSLSERVRAVLDPAHPRHQVHFATAAFTVCATVALALAVGPAQVVAQTMLREGDSPSIPTSLAARSFDAVSIRPSDSGTKGETEINVQLIGDRPSDSDERPAPGVSWLPGSKLDVSFTGATLRSLIAMAYAPIPRQSSEGNPMVQELPDERLTGGPDWIGTDEFTIEAAIVVPKADRGDDGVRELQAMMRRMLQEHFNLVVHVEPQSTPAYRLVRARSFGALGPGLRPVENCVGPGIGEGGLGELRLTCVTMDMLASSIHLTEVLGRPVLDRTGISGAFDVSLTYAPTRDELVTIYELDPENLPSSVGPGQPRFEELALRPSIFDAVQTQLGLRLEPTQTTVESLVVDWADKPTPVR